MVPSSHVGRLGAALAAARYSYCGGSTHGFYHYPARFSPDVARAVIELFSTTDDLVLDPFMGGGTSIIEGLALGRRMVGIDLNALAHFVADVRTTPLSAQDEQRLRIWAGEVADRFGGPALDNVRPPGILNLPSAVETFMTGGLACSDILPFPRQREFARCALLRLGQWALDCRDFAAPRRRRLARKLPELVEEMFRGLHDFVEICRTAGLPKNGIARHRLLLHRNAIGLHEDPRISALGTRPKLVFTSPPYPSVHVLYHRWQYRGRKETPAPYWIARVPDGFYESYYTGGSRTPTGRENYFKMIEAAFRSVRSIIDPRGLVVQLVGFSNAETQLPRYLGSMYAAGFEEVDVGGEDRLDRRVPNRKWYAKLKGAVDASSELLLFHRPRRMR
jgi:DNA methylase